MTVSVSLILAGGDGAEFDTRDFDTLPRIGETIVFTQGVDMRRERTPGLAYCTVVDVQHDYRVGYTTGVHAWVVILASSADDRNLLLQLFEIERGAQ